MMCQKLKEHFSILIMGGGALSVFITNIIAKNYLLDSDFIAWSYVISLVSLLFSFSLFGQEQLILRYFKNDSGKLLADRYSLLSVICAFALFPILAYTLDGTFIDFHFGMQVIVYCLLISMVQVGYQLFRTSGHFIISQIIMCAWKLLLLPFLIISLIFNIDINYVFIIALSGSSCILLIALYRCLKRVDVYNAKDKSDKKIVSFSFFLTLGTLSLVSYIERFFVESYVNSYMLAQYIYALTLIVAPFNILASYLGFKEAVKYKNSFSIDILHADLIKVAYLTLPAILVWGVGVILFYNVLKLEISFLSIIALLTICFLRCVYSLFSSCISVVLPGNKITYLNIAFLLLCICFYFIASQVSLNLTSSIFLICLLWLSRIILIYIFLRSDN